MVHCWKSFRLDRIATAIANLTCHFLEQFAKPIDLGVCESCFAFSIPLLLHLIEFIFVGFDVSVNIWFGANVRRLRAVRSYFDYDIWDSVFFPHLERFARVG